MSIKVQTRDDALAALRKCLTNSPDFLWVRFFWATTERGGDSTADIKLLVMPRDPWWSLLEMGFLGARLERITGRMVFLEDERTLHPCELEDVENMWETIIERDVVRRFDSELSSRSEWTKISQSLQLADGGRPSKLGEWLRSVNCREFSEQRFSRFIHFTLLGNLFGSNFALEPDQAAEISNAGQEAGREALALACDVHQLVGHSPPRSINHAFSHLANRGWLNYKSAKKLASWVHVAVPGTWRQEPLLAESRINALLDIGAEEFRDLSDAVVQAASELNKPWNVSVPDNIPAFDFQKAKARLEDLLSESHNSSECEILRKLHTAIFNRLALGPSNNASANDPNWQFKDEPIFGGLAFRREPLDPHFPRLLAMALYDDPNLVYPLHKAAMAAPDQPFDAVWGRPSRFRPLGTLSLPEFLRANGGGIIYFEHPEHFDPSHMDVLASMLKKGSLWDSTLASMYIGNTCILVSAHFPIGSVKELSTSPPWTNVCFLNQTGHPNNSSKEFATMLHRLSSPSHRENKC